MEYFGNREILNQYKIGFLCSRKVPANIILQTYDWAIKQRNENICVVSGFHSKIEKDVFDILVKGTQPIVLVIARGMLKRFDKILLNLIDENRLLIISPFDSKITRSTSRTAKKRNQLIAEISDKIFIPFAKEGGNIDQIKTNFTNKMLMIK